jgi:hypothetical protein
MGHETWRSGVIRGHLKGLREAAGLHAGGARDDAGLSVHRERAGARGTTAAALAIRSLSADNRTLFEHKALATGKTTLAELLRSAPSRSVTHFASTARWTTLIDRPPLIRHA